MSRDIGSFARLPRLKNSPPIIVVTASSQVKDYAQGAAAGIVDYLVKPVDRDRLIGAVRKALSRPGSQKGKFARDYLVSDLITAGLESADSAAADGIIELLDQARGEYRRLIRNLPIPYARSRTRHAAGSLLQRRVPSLRGRRLGDRSSAHVFSRLAGR